MVHFLAFAPGRGKWRRHYENGGANEIHLPLPGANGKLLPHHLPLADILSHLPLNSPLENLISLKNQIKTELEMTRVIFSQFAPRNGRSIGFIQLLPPDQNRGENGAGANVPRLLALTPTSCFCPIDLPLPNFLGICP